MTANYFSVPIFLICFREVLEAAIILSVLLALVEQIVKRTDGPPEREATKSSDGAQQQRYDPDLAGSMLELESLNQDAANHIQLTEEDQTAYEAKIVKRLRIQIFSGTFTGLFVSLCIGAAFLAIYYTQLHDIYGNSEELWEGIFSLVACAMIFIMGITMMQMERSKIKWRIKLSKAFEQENIIEPDPDNPKISKLAFVKSVFDLGGKNEDASISSSKYLLFFLPAATVLREGLEAVVFIGGVSLGQPASSIPIAAVTGIMLGVLIGYAIYSSSSRLNLSIFLMISTIFLMYIGAGLIAKAVWYLTMHKFIKLVGGDAAEAGDGPGSFPVDGYIWHLDYGNPENKLAAGGWTIFAGVFGWNNTGTIATVMVYIGFWMLVSVTLIYMKWKEGRCAIFNISSAARKRRFDRLAARKHDLNAPERQLIDSNQKNNIKDNSMLQTSPNLNIVPTI